MRDFLKLNHTQALFSLRAEVDAAFRVFWPAALSLTLGRSVGGRFFLFLHCFLSEFSLGLRKDGTPYLPWPDFVFFSSDGFPCLGRRFVRHRGFLFVFRQGLLAGGVFHLSLRYSC